MKSKFLVLHPSDQIDRIIDKANLQGTKNGAFDAVLLLGAVTSAPTVKVDQPTYFTQATPDAFSEQLAAETSTSVDVAPRMTLVQPPLSIVTLNNGVRAGFLSGPDFDPASIDEKINNYGGHLDILVSYKWPKVIAAREKLTLVADPNIDSVVVRLKPRYHFAVGAADGKFFELPPFRWDDGRTTRFISLGQEGTKEKWFYAFGIDPQAPAPVADAHLIVNPFAAGEPLDRKRPPEAAPGTSEQLRTAKKPKSVSPDSCFFCLSNPKVEKHMIVSIGESAYVTTAKGPLPKPTREIPFPCHGIIIPIEHVATLRGLGPSLVEHPSYQEMDRFRSAAANAVARTYPDHVLVSFEINRADNVHLHIQFLPLHKSLLDTFADELAAKAALNNEKFQRNQPLHFERYTSATDPGLLDTLNNYDHIVFHVYSSPLTLYAARLADASRLVDLQFPRRVLAATLKCPKRARWDKCKQTAAQETADCNDFKAFFEKFDFTR